MDYKMWRRLQDNYQGVSELRQRIAEEWNKLDQRIIDTGKQLDSDRRDLDL